MRVTVGICTWNRSKYLRLALDALSRLEVPAEASWEVIVVDNNSTDGTREVVESFARSLPVRYEFEQQPGKSHALNRAIDAATGQCIAWTDDDALVDTRWLTAYIEAFEMWPDATFFGGPVRPWFERSPPAWMHRVMPLVQGAYALRDFGDESFEFTKSKVPYGVNMAVRTKAQRAFRYDCKLGPRPGTQVRGEETAMLRSMLDEGLTGRWVPGAAVEHHVPEERQSTRYLKAFYRGLGETQGRERPEQGLRPLWLWRRALVGEMEYRAKRAVCGPENWIPALKRSSVAWGRLFGSKSGVR